MSQPTSGNFVAIDTDLYTAVNLTELELLVICITNN